MLGLLRCCHPTLEYRGTMTARTVGGRLSSDAPVCKKNRTEQNRTEQNRTEQNRNPATLLRKRKTRRLMWTLDEFLIGCRLSNLPVPRIPDTTTVTGLETKKCYLCRRVYSDIMCPLCHIVMFVLFAFRPTGRRLCVREQNRVLRKIMVLLCANVFRELALLNFCSTINPPTPTSIVTGNNKRINTTTMELNFFTSSGAKVGRHVLVSARCTDLFLTAGYIFLEQFSLTDPTAYVSSHLVIWGRKQTQFSEMDLLFIFPEYQTMEQVKNVSSSQRKHSVIRTLQK